MVAVSDLIHHKFPKIPSTTTRWDLIDRNAFPQWHSDLRRIAKYATAPAFLGSQPPGVEEGVYAGPMTRSSVRATADAFSAHAGTHAGMSLEDWLRHNSILYDIIMASISLDEDKFQHVESSFGGVSDGNALYEWVLTHADDRKMSSQLTLKESLKKLVIQDSASAEDVDAVLKIVQLNWPKIKGYDNSTPAPSIEFALGLFPSSYVRMPYIAALLVHQDGGGRWRTFAAFREEPAKKAAEGMGQRKAAAREARWEEAFMCGWAGGWWRRAQRVAADRPPRAA
ncbi:hypothetical protein AB1Y20_009772 [Prymnesium parvum]|uniref:Uncharacterized protein n=1 Tax=Prymnesium parvum TaxID=97485 RepID=A0AB34K310_PRYPA